MKITDAVSGYIKKHNLISPGDSIVCGLSGGADSCAMVSILHSMSLEMGFSLVCAHINHGLRGKEADRDELFAESFAKSLKLPFFCKHANVSAYAKQRGISPEEAGREIRYEFFREVLLKTHSNKIATAHNKNDNAETILMHIVRSSGIKGICGIPPKRGEIIRPILALSREEIEAYCKENGICYVTDSTNAETDYTRNKFRLEIIPALEKLNPSVTEALCRLGSAATLQQSLINRLASQVNITETENSVEIPLSELEEAHPALYVQILENALQMLCPGATVSAAEAENVFSLLESGKTTGVRQLENSFTARLSYDRLIISKEEKTDDFEFMLTPHTPLNIFGKKIYISDTLPETGEYIPWDSHSPVTVRNRRPGDKMKIRQLTRKLQDLFVNNKIDRILRDKLIIILLGDTVAWVEKIGKSDSALVAQGKKYIVINSED